MYDLDVETVDTFAVGDGAWVVHNQNQNCPLPLEVGNWENRFKGQPKVLLPGIYEYFSGGRADAPIYVGMSWGQSLTGRLRGKRSNFGRSWNNVVSSSIDFPSHQAALVAERIRIEQLIAMPDIGVSGVSNATDDRIIRTASRADVENFLKNNNIQNIPGWPSWLQLPDKVVDVPGWN